MKFSTTKTNLSYAVQTVQRAVSPRIPLPILSGILFEAKDKYLSLTASDMDLTIRCTIEVNVEEDGALVLPARYISELVRHLPDIPIHFESIAESTSATISYGSSQLNIHGFSPKQYPQIPDVGDRGQINISQELLKEMLRQILFAVSSDETRPIFTGVLFQIENGHLKLVATDTHRLALREASLEPAPDLIINTVVPGKTLSEVVRLISSTEYPLSIAITENHAFFATETMQIISRVIAGKFPPYEQVIPQEFVTSVRINTRELLDATERAALLIRDGIPVVRFLFGQNRCVVSVHTEAGWIREELPAQVEGEELDIYFNARYIGDNLRAVAEEEIELQLTGSLSAAVIRPVGEENYKTLLLPARPCENGE